MKLNTQRGSINLDKSQINWQKNPKIKEIYDYLNSKEDYFTKDIDQYFDKLQKDIIEKIDQLKKETKKKVLEINKKIKLKLTK